MGVISDAIDSLQEWCEDLFKDGIKSQFDSISDLMTETFDKTTKSDGLISTFLTGHPASFTGSSSGETAIWTTIELIRYYIRKLNLEHIYIQVLVSIPYRKGRTTLFLWYIIEKVPVKPKTSSIIFD